MDNALVKRAIIATAFIASACSTASPPVQSATQAPTIAVEVPHTSAAPVAPQSAIPALEAIFQAPQGLAFDSDGNLYVSECAWTYAAIDKVDRNGMVTRFAGTGETGFSGDGGLATSAQLYCPTGIAVGPDGAVYFADHVNNRIRRVDAEGVITTFAGSGPAGLGLGSFSGDGGPATQATLREPWGVAFDQTGRLYIADRDNVRVRRVGLGGVITTVAGNGIRGSTGDGAPATQATICAPIGVAIDPTGNLVIPDACTTAIRVVDGNGTITTIARTDSPDPGHDIGSEGNASFDAEGLMLVQAGPRIFSIDASGTVTPVAGTGSVGVPTDGSLAVESPLPLEVWGLALDLAGNLYVADGASSVYRIDTSGLIHIFAGKHK